MAAAKENKTIVKQQSYYVVKSNDLIQKSRYAMNAQQLKVTMYLVSKIKPHDSNDETYEFDVKQFCKACNIDWTNGKNYQDVKSALKDMADKSIWLEMPDASEVLVRWFNRVVINKGKGTFSIKFHEDMFPYLANLSERYTQYSLENVLPMKSKYGLRLYELLKSYQNLGGLNISLNELRKRLDCDSYPRYPDFRVNVIERALADINEYSDIAVTYTAIKNGRSYSDILFEISEPNKEDSYVRHLNREGALQSE